MNYALIGCGRISSNHIKAAIENGLNISALCDINEPIIDNFINVNNIDKSSIRKYTNHNKMLEEESLDLISIAAKSGMHAEIALDCIDAGVNIIVEKPLALSLEEADEIIRRSERMNVKVCCCHQNRFNQSVQNVYKAIREGKFGKISHGTVHVRWNRNKDYYKQAPWRGTWTEDGGTLMNQCIHSIDIFRWMMGAEIDEVFAYTKNQYHDYIETEDIALALVKFKNGAIGTIEGTVNVYPSNLEEMLYIFGKTGTAKLGGKSLNEIDIWKFEDESFDVDSSYNAELKTGHSAVFKDMTEAIENNRAPYIDAKAGRDALELILAIHKSSKEGIPVKLPLTQCESKFFIGMF